MKKTIFFIILVISLASDVFAQIPDLALYTNDVRIEQYQLNSDFNGYILYVRKKPGTESLMLTDLSGQYALRALEWNEINGNERREFSGRQLGDLHSRYSILSSTPVYDREFGSAFKLFLPWTVVYGNPSAPAGIVILDMRRNIHFNIRAFDRMYADPNIGRYQNNDIWLSYVADKEYELPPALPMQAIQALTPSRGNDIEELKRILKFTVGVGEAVFTTFRDDTEMQRFLRRAFRLRHYGQ